MTEPEPNPASGGQGPPADHPAAAGLEEPETRYPFWNWTDALILISLALPVLVLTSVLIAAGFAITSHALPRIRALIPITAMFIFYGLYFFIFQQFFRLRYRRPMLPSLGWIAPRPTRVGPAVLGILTAFASVALASILRTPDVKTPLDEMLSDPVSIALTGIFAVTLAPVFEELFFRGFLFPLVARSLGWIAAAIVAALPFALLHGPQYAWSWQRVAVIFFAGFAFGWMRWRSGSTAAAAVMHATYNATFVTALVVSKFSPTL